MSTDLPLGIHPRITPEALKRLDELRQKLERRLVSPNEWRPRRMALAVHLANQLIVRGQA